MGDLAAVGTAMKALNMFIKVGIELYKIHSQFKRQMNRLIDTLKIYAPLIKKIEKSNNSKDQEGLKDLQSKLEEGRTLIDSCLKVTASQFKKKHSFNKDLDKLIGDLYQRLEVLQTHAIIDMKNTNEGAGAITSFRCEPPDPPLFTVGLDKPLHDLKEKLLTRGKSILVLTAPGGFGKTTLATEFCHNKEVKDKFQNNIFFVPVPKYSSVHDDPEQGKNIILNHIVQQLHQSMHSQLPASSSQIQANAVNKGLRQFLTEAGEKPLLLVLDNVRPGLEFLVDKFHQIKMPDYKILVTSRSDLPRFGSSYYLKSLKKEDARTCFNHFLENKSRDIPTDLKEKILEHCKGLPLAIEVVVPSLLREKAVQTWKTIDAKWSCGSILDSVTDLLDRLQTSVDALDENQAIVKECFIDLGVFLKDQTIPAAALIDIWTELHVLKGEDDESIANLHELTERSFANLVFPRRDKTEVAEDDSYYSQHIVAQHDILRDLAIRQSNEEIRSTDRLIIDVPNKTFPRWWTGEIYEQPINARLISISTEGEFPKEWDKMKLPKAEVLVLHFQAESYALPNFLKTMSRSLKVLIVTNHGLLHAKVSKFKLLGSLSNIKRIRLEGISIPSMKKNSMEVKSLHKISLFMCNFDQASSRSSINILEAFPNLVEINIDYCNNLKELPAKLCGLVSLKKLSITNCDKLHALPEEIGDLVNLEVLRLLACIKLLQLPCSISKLTDLKLFDLSDCWSIKKLSDIGEMHFLKKLGMRHCPGLRTLPQSISNLHQEMDVICDEETKKLWDDFPYGYGSNIHIIVKNSRDICPIDSANSNLDTDFPQ